MMFWSSIFRALGPFKGKQRLARWLMGDSIRNARDVRIEGKYGCRYLIPNLREIIGFDLYIDGIFEPYFVSFMRDRLPQGGAFLDLGANIGAITVPLCRQRSDIRVCAVEASPVMLPYLTENVRQNDIRQCRILPQAIWEVSGQELFFYVPEVQYGKGMIARKEMEGKQVAVQTTTIDEVAAACFDGHLDFIKVDIEGYEYFAFRGGETLLSSSAAPDILFEFIDDTEAQVQGLKPGDAQRLLFRYGYALYRIGPAGMIPLTEPLSRGYAMIFATKKR